MNHGAKYEGNFMNNSKTGKGKLQYMNGTMYEGEFLEDKRHGKGKIIFKSMFNDKLGNSYDGEWD